MLNFSSYTVQLWQDMKFDWGGDGSAVTEGDGDFQSLALLYEIDSKKQRTNTNSPKSQLTCQMTKRILGKKNKHKIEKKEHDTVCLTLASLNFFSAYDKQWDDWYFPVMQLLCHWPHKLRQPSAPPDTLLWSKRRLLVSLDLCRSRDKNRFIIGVHACLFISFLIRRCKFNGHHKIGMGSQNLIAMSSISLYSRRPIFPTWQGSHRGSNNRAVWKNQSSQNFIIESLLHCLSLPRNHVSLQFVRCHFITVS